MTETITSSVKKKPQRNVGKNSKIINWIEIKELKPLKG
jgi:hypothetical protein